MFEWSSKSHKTNNRKSRTIYSLITSSPRIWINRTEGHCYGGKLSIKCSSSSCRWRAWLARWFVAAVFTQPSPDAVSFDPGCQRVALYCFRIALFDRVSSSHLTPFYLPGLMTAQAVHRGAGSWEWLKFLVQHLSLCRGVIYFHIPSVTLK